jgi:hypothetical protein
MRLQLTYNFKKDLIIFFKRLYAFIFIISVWYSLTMFQIDILNIGIFGETELPLYLSMFGMLVEIIVFMFLLVIFTSIFIGIMDFIKYAFMIELKRKRNDH